MIRIAIVDDEKEFLEMTVKFLVQISQEMKIEFKIDEYDDGRPLYEKYQKNGKNRYDILLLDIEMPGMNGMDAAKAVRELDESVAIIFLTRMENFAINGYEVGASDFIVKPISYPVFSLKIKRIVGRIKKEIESYVLINLNETTKKIALNDILYAEVIAHRLHIYLKSQEIIANKTLTSFENEINDKAFVRCNSGILVNLKYVSELNSKCVIVAGMQLPVSRSKYKTFMKELTEYVGSIN